MTSDSELKRRRDLSFLQAEGLADLPQQLSLRQVNAGFRSSLFSYFYNSLKYERGLYVGDLAFVMKDYWVNHLHKYEDEYYQTDVWLTDLLSSVVKKARDTTVLDFYQFSLRWTANFAPYNFERLSSLCESHRLAYRVDADETNFPRKPTLIPNASPEQGAAVSEAIAALKAAGIGGGRTHLINAASALTAREWATAARESISAVESAACAVSGETTRDLGAALTTLEKSNKLHPALKSAISKLYGYTSSERGIRHSLIDDNNIAVDETLALFLFGTCASCAAYLARLAKP